MSLKSRSEIYDRLEKLVYEFSAEQDNLAGLSGRESTEVIAEKFAKWLQAGAIETIRDSDKARTGKVFL